MSDKKRPFNFCMTAGQLEEHFDSLMEWCKSRKLTPEESVFVLNFASKGVADHIGLELNLATMEVEKGEA
jgi:hypothetical protein